MYIVYTCRPIQVHYISTCTMYMNIHVRAFLSYGHSDWEYYTVYNIRHIEFIRSDIYVQSMLSFSQELYPSLELPMVLLTLSP